MSRAYRISVSESVTRVVHVEDGVTTGLELLPILPPADMQRVLRDELLRRGFVVVEGDPGTVVRVEADGIVIEVELASAQVTVSLDDTSSVEASASRSVTSEQPPLAAEVSIREKLQKKVDEDLEKSVARQAERAREAVTERLEKRLGDLRRELDQVVNGATATALKERAAQLGEIETVDENAETGELTITVKV